MFIAVLRVQKNKWACTAEWFWAYAMIHFCWIVQNARVFFTSASSVSLCGSFSISWSVEVLSLSIAMTTGWTFRGLPGPRITFSLVALYAKGVQRIGSRLPCIRKSRWSFQTSLPSHVLCYRDLPPKMTTFSDKGVFSICVTSREFWHVLYVLFLRL